MKKIFLVIAFLTAFNSKTIYAADLPDCNESINRAVFSFNMTVDKYFFKPIAQVYNVFCLEISIQDLFIYFVHFLIYQ